MIALATLTAERESLPVIAEKASYGGGRRESGRTQETQAVGWP